MKLENLFTYLNHTNFSDHEDVKIMYKRIFESIYNSSFEDSKIYLSVLIFILLFLSVIGSIGNLFLICIIKYIFNKNFNRQIQSKLVAYVYWHESDINMPQNTIHDLNKNERRKEITELYQNFNNMRSQIVFNSNLKQFYYLICFLAITDLFTCSIAIPATAYEIWRNMKISELNCKLFEFIRAFGVVESNFTIVLIAIERYATLCNPRNPKKYLIIRISLTISLSILIAVLCMFQASIYQRTEFSEINTGICLMSEHNFKNQYSQIINYIITSILITGGLFVSTVYGLVFFKSYKTFKNKREYFDSDQDTVIKLTKLSSKTSTRNAVNEELKSQPIQNNDLIINKRNLQLTCYCFSLNRHTQIAITIVLVSFIYYVSIIPWCLTINGIVKYNPYIHYMFFLNNTLNPFIYLFLNPNFRKCGSYLVTLFLKE